MSGPGAGHRPAATIRLNERYVVIIFMRINRRFLLTCTLLALGLFLFGCGNSSADFPRKKVLVLGFDGMDPQLLKEFVEAGKLPNFERLIRTGDFRPLSTTMPPQSPVAWATFATGMNPGGHGIFDFIHRDPSTVLPYLSTSTVESANRTINIGSWVIPLSSGKVKLLRKGRAFWEYLDEAGVPTTIFRIPANFPPIDTDVRQLSGMGTPDILGTYGTFSYYTDEPREQADDLSGGVIYPIRVKNNRVEAELFGPRNTFRKGSPQAKTGFTVFLDPENAVAKISVSGRDLLLKQGEWSDWVKISFTMIPFLQSVDGICRFYLKETRPFFKLYVTPINIDPASPALPISTPENYSETLARELGAFYTLGIPEDTNALSENVLNDGEFLAQTGIVLAEQLKMLEYELSRFESGLLFFYLGRTDVHSHMFWRTISRQHPAYDAESDHQRVIEETYVDADNVLGRVLKKLAKNTLLIVVSDHGFGPFNRAFNLNTWLKNEGYVSLVEDNEGDLLQNVDWGQTRAYGLGFNALYVNEVGREPYGIVRPGSETEGLLNEISEKLISLTDPESGERIVSKVYKASELYRGPYANEAPDLIIGYNRGYRVSWESVLGKFPKGILRDNEEKWSGDHLIEASFVPGILIANRRIESQSPGLHDLAPTILSEFGIPSVPGMIGVNVFQRRLDD